MKRLIAMFAFLSAMLSSTLCYAEESGSVGGVYRYDGVPIEGVEVSLFKIADYDNDDFIYTEPFVGHEKNVPTMTNSQLGEYGKELARIEAEPSEEVLTSAGKYGFEGLEQGLYLVTFKDKTIGDYTYSALPIVLTMPDANFNYEIELTTKSEKSCPECVEPNASQVDTRERSIIYIRLLSICIIIETLVLYAIIKQRKRESNEER